MATAPRRRPSRPLSRSAALPLAVLLLASACGKETRAELREAADETREALSEAGDAVRAAGSEVRQALAGAWQETSDELQPLVEELKRRSESVDREEAARKVEDLRQRLSKRFADARGESKRVWVEEVEPELRRLQTALKKKGAHTLEELEQGLERLRRQLED